MVISIDVDLPFALDVKGGDGRCLMYFWSWLPSSPKGNIVGNMFLVSYNIELIVLDGNSLAKDKENICMENLNSVTEHFM